MEKKKIIVLYGPPGVGKLTTAIEISKRNDFKVFHTHVVSDLLSEFFQTGTKEFAEKFEELWFFLFERLLKSEETPGMVITLVFGVQTFQGKRDEEFFKKIKKKGEEMEGEFLFVKLECLKEEIEKRISSPSRKEYKKIMDPVFLEKIRENYRVDEKIPGIESFVLDTTSYSSKEAAQKIIENLK